MVPRSPSAEKNKDRWSSGSDAIVDTISGAQNKKNTKQHFHCPLALEILSFSPIFPTVQASSLQSKTQNYENQRSKENQTRKREPTADNSKEIQQHRPVFVFQQRFCRVKKSDKSKDKRQVDHCAKQGAVQWIRILMILGFTLSRRSLYSEKDRRK